MKERLREREQREEAADSAPSSLVGAAPYRQAGQLEGRAERLEELLADARSDLADAEKKLKIVREEYALYRRRRAISMGGFGALAGALVGTGVYWLTSLPEFLVPATAFGVLMGMLISARFDPPDDGFPAAPSPRTH